MRKLLVGWTHAEVPLWIARPATTSLLPLLRLRWTRCLGTRTSFAGRRKGREGLVWSIKWFLYLYLLFHLVYWFPFFFSFFLSEPYASTSDVQRTSTYHKLTSTIGRSQHQYLSQRLLINRQFKFAFFNDIGYPAIYTTTGVENHMSVLPNVQEDKYISQDFVYG